jgi:class 3 adenylate cyclase
MATCRSCAHENQEGQRFCGDCGTPLAAAPARPVAEERKVVTIVFCDLVNFTARSEVLDPEDVRAFLLPYYEVLTSEIARHGGVIDKFLGDGVMAVSGAPTSYEDDPERAVRMALRALDRLPELDLDLHARIGVNTREVMVAIEAMERGDAITGDADNTAARLQTVAHRRRRRGGTHLGSAVFDLRLHVAAGDRAQLIGRMWSTSGQGAACNCV